MMRVDYRYLRLASVPAVRHRGRPARARLRARAQHRRRRLGALAQVGPLPAVHPAEIAKLALVIYLAHWFAKRGTRGPRLLGRDGPVPDHRRAGHRARASRSPTSARRSVIALTAFTMFFVAGREPRSTSRSMAGGACLAAIAGRPARLPDGPDPGLARPVVGPARHRLPHGPGPARARRSAALLGRASARAGSRRPVPAERVQRLHLRDGRPGVRAARRGRRDRAVPRSWPTLGIRDRARARRTRSGRCWPPGSPPGCASRRSSTSASSSTLLPITGITLPFISAGGSSLIISFAAVGILLSISRETVEKGTWNDDATADRGRGNGRAHLPGAGRRPVAPRATGRA